VSAGRARTGIAIILLMGVFAIFTLASYVAVVLRGGGNPAGIDMDANRFRSLREELPARGVVGYLSDSNLDKTILDKTGEGLEGTRVYYLTQYYLAPVVVARDPAHDLVIANFASPAAVAAAAATHNLTVMRDFGNGVALLRRVSQ
jgi:hypothetical protein